MTVKVFTIFNNLKFNNKWKPITEDGRFSNIEFDKRFPIDRTYSIITMFKKYRIRIVKHPHNHKNTYTIFTIFYHKNVFRKLFNMKQQTNFVSLSEYLTTDELKSKYNYIL